MIVLTRNRAAIGLALLVACAGAAIWVIAAADAPISSDSSSCAASADLAMVRIPGGTAQLGGTDLPDDAPPRRVTVPSFRISATEVTNRQFAAFVSATGYRTVAERAPRAADHPGVDPALLVPGSAVFSPPSQPGSLDDMTGWWRFVPGADWRHPEGPGSHLRGRANYPVVHVAYEDALAYARWRGHGLPAEAQWELAARGGLDGKRFAWGDEYAPGGSHRANAWQGAFPLVNSGADGFVGRSPVACFPPNGFGLYDMIGNVWEWTSDGDPQAAGTRIIKGGSYLCAPNYCARYRPAARQFGDSSLGASHIGFRTVAP